MLNINRTSNSKQEKSCQKSEIMPKGLMIILLHSLIRLSSFAGSDLLLCVAISKCTDESVISSICLLFCLFHFHSLISFHLFNHSHPHQPNVSFFHILNRPLPPTHSILPSQNCSLQSIMYSYKMTKNSHWDF